LGSAKRHPEAAIEVAKETAIEAAKSREQGAGSEKKRRGDAETRREELVRGAGSSEQKRLKSKSSLPHL